MRQPRWSRFDTIVWGTMAGLVLWTAVLIARGDQVGLRAAQLLPSAGAEGVSSQTPIQILFDEPIAGEPTAHLTITPPISGTAVWQGRTFTFHPSEPLADNTQYNVTFNGDLVSQEGRHLLHPITWQFRTGQPRIIYIAWSAGQAGNQLYTVIPGQAPVPLTQTEGYILDYAVSPDGRSIAYSVSRANSGTDIWLIDADGQNNRLLLGCEESACSQATWSPDGNRLLYERRTVLQAGAPPGAPRLWWLDVATGQTTAVFQDSQWLGLFPTFSHDGQWISYTAPQSQEVQAYNLQSGQSLLIPSQTGEPAAWSPDNRSLLMTQVVLDEQKFAIQILKVSVPSGETVSLSGADSATNDSWPLWSPDGQWIAFTRKPPNTATGKQVWLMRPDGSEAQDVTQRPDIHFVTPAWSPDGRFLTFHGYALSQPDKQVIWLLDLQTRQLQEVASPGLQPAWLP